MGVRIGLDFGTSNSAVALPGKQEGEAARVLDIDPAGADPRLMRSVLFFPELSPQEYVGGEAIERYLAEGEGRFVQSVKSFLHSTTFKGTEIRRKRWDIEALVSLPLRRMRERIEALEGPIEAAVFGRPAVFSHEPDKDALAEKRLIAAAEQAGFPTPTMLIEPVAAALRYEESLDENEVVLVGDFGAGTSDFTLMRLGPDHRNKPNRREDIVSSSGVRVGGDSFDAVIVEHRLLGRFGHRSTYRSMLDRLEVPVWMTRKLLSWHELSLLREPSTMRFLHDALKTSDRPRELESLITLAEENLAFHLFRAVESTKRALGESDEAPLSFHELDIDIETLVTREEFESWSEPLREELSASLGRCLEGAGGLQPDAVFLTGGTSRIPSVRRLFVERFGTDHVREGDSFTSVAAGLGAAAGRLF